MKPPKLNLFQRQRLTAGLVAGLAMPMCFYLNSTVQAKSAQECFLVDANYELIFENADAFRLETVTRETPNVYSDLDFRLISPNGGSYDFQISVSNGYAQTFLVQPVEPGKRSDETDSVSSALYFFNADLSLAYAQQASDPAPAYLFLPDLGVALWYRGSLDAPREALPTAMWKLNCPKS